MKNKIEDKYNDFLNFDFHNNLWLTLIKLRQEMIKGNLSLIEVKEAIKNNKIKGIDLENLDNLKILSIYYDLFSIVAFKEQFEALVDLEKLKNDCYQQDLDKNYPEFGDCLIRLSYLRSNIAHAGLKISKNGDGILLKGVKDGKKNEIEISSNELKTYLNSMIKCVTPYKMATPSKLLYNSKNTFSNNLTFYSFSRCSQNLLDDCFSDIDNKLANKLLTLKIGDKLNQLILENPSLKWDDIKNSVIKYLKNYKFVNGYDDVVKMCENDEQVLDFDTLLYTQFVLSSKCYDSQINYDEYIDSNKQPISSTDMIKYIRNSIVHGTFKIEKGKILFRGLNIEGASQNKEVRKQKRKMSGKEVQELLRNNPIFVDKNLEDKIELSRNDLLELDKKIVETYKNKNYEDEDEKR